MEMVAIVLVFVTVTRFGLMVVVGFKVYFADVTVEVSVVLLVDVVTEV